MMVDRSLLAAVDVTVRYADRAAVQAASVQIPPGQVVAIIGPNGSGKSTLLKALARLLRPETGAVLLDGREISAIPSVAVARRLALLPQAPVAPGDLTVRELVSFGRAPHVGTFQRLRVHDQAAIDRALRLTELTGWADRRLTALSGGERQRVWIALALAQEPAILLLDEPTTYLDIAYQLDLMELLTHLNRQEGLTVVMVLHDLNQAARFADQIIAMKNGRILAQGAPSDVIQPELLRDCFGVEALVMQDQRSGRPLCQPLSRAKLCTSTVQA
jgi:iron complex transport system ATP-binding protein